MDEPRYCITIDVEWAAPEVLADLVEALDERELPATFFCTHAGVDVPGYERGLHPNFRFTGDDARGYFASAEHPVNEGLYGTVLDVHGAVAPEATGVRTHSLIFDSMLVPELMARGLKYDSSTYLPFQRGVRPFLRERGLCEIPITYMDHLDLVGQHTGWSIDALGLDEPGLQVFDFHPNIVFTNAATEAEYLATKSYYHDAGQLLAARRSGVGARSLWIDLLDALAARRDRVSTCGAVAEETIRSAEHG